MGLVLATLLLSVAGCRDGFAYDQRGGPAIADHIRSLESPLLDDVHYRAGDFMDAATIDLVLMPGVETSDARAFMCATALPWAEAADPPDGLSIVAWDRAGKVLASDSECR